MPISVVHEPTNPRDAKALAFVCELDGKENTIGYIVSELPDEVHDAYRAGDIVSVKLAWVRYITEWRARLFCRSGYREKRPMVRCCHFMVKYKID